jgi:S-formylglutathione hydrolase FrmB
VSFFSNQLHRTVPFMAVLPNDGEAYPGQVPDFVTGKMKTLFLLHGYSGDENDYLSNSLIRELSAKYKIAVIMPAGDNLFYVDSEDDVIGYGRYIGEELVEYTRRIFHLSGKREDTYIGGLSMGGFGAIRNGLKYHNTFGAAISFSGVLQLFEALETIPADYNTDFEAGTFGDLKQAAKSDKNPSWLVRSLAGKKNLPKIYLACGTEDHLLHHSRSFRDLLVNKGFRVTYEEGPGGHEWDFWDTYIKKVIDWLPLDEACQGINSGNVK